MAHINGLIDADVWFLSLNTLTDEPGRDTVYARADIPVAELVPHKLRAVRDDDPFERHSMIVGWPDSEDRNKRKEQCKLICLQLSQCEEIVLVVPKEPITLNKV